MNFQSFLNQYGKKGKKKGKKKKLTAAEADAELKRFMHGDNAFDLDELKRLKKQRKKQKRKKNSLMEKWKTLPHAEFSQQLCRGVSHFPTGSTTATIYRFFWNTHTTYKSTKKIQNKLGVLCVLVVLIFRKNLLKIVFHANDIPTLFFGIFNCFFCAVHVTVFALFIIVVNQNCHRWTFP